MALKVKVDSQLQHDMREGDVIFQYTTVSDMSILLSLQKITYIVDVPKTAWVMWVLNFVNLSNGVSMLLYDGSPFHPGPDILLKLIEKYK